MSRASPTAADPGRLAERSTPEAAAPLLATRSAQVRGALASDSPILTLGGLGGRGAGAAARHGRRAGAGGACYRVEIYNYANNSTILAIVDPAAGLVRSVVPLADTQPTVVPQHLMDLAAQIAIAAPEVREELDHRHIRR